MTDDAATVVARYAFDPWGKRRLLAGDINATEHGFTGHEHLDEVGLIHANGRLYDPVLGRFVSADPYIQMPDNLQSYNRYAYVWNNPLSATDPSGYFSLKKIFKAIINPNQAVLSLVSYKVGQALVSIGSAFCGPAYALCSAAGNYDNAKAHGASTSQALRAGAIAGVTSYLSQGVDALGQTSSFATNVVLHGIAGCIGSSIQGGSCGSGALSGAFSYGANSLIPGNFGTVGNLVRSAVIGGTASMLGGGKFENGAISSAFSYLLQLGSNSSEDGLAQRRRLSPAADSENRPELERLANDPSIRPEIDRAWRGSNPYGTAAEKNERGFWILKNENTGLTVQQFPSNGDRDSLIPGPKPGNAIAFFHTHPNTGTGIGGDGYLLGPSPDDLAFSQRRDVNIPGIIRSHNGLYFFGPPLRR